MAPSKELTPEQIAEKVSIARERLANGRHIADSDVVELVQSVAQLQRQLAELSADHKRACLSLRSVERQLADLEAIKQQARKDALLELAGMVDAIKQRKLASRDIAHSNGRVVVAHCRQSDVETCDEIDGIIRSLVGERMANASPAEPIYRIPESGRAFSKDPNKPEGKIKHAPPTASGQGGER